MANEEAKLFVAGSARQHLGRSAQAALRGDRRQGRRRQLAEGPHDGAPARLRLRHAGDPAEAQAARDALDGSMQAGNSISVRPFQAEPPRRDGAGGAARRAPRGRRSGWGRRRPSRPGRAAAQAPDRTLYVGNLPYDCDAGRGRRRSSTASRADSVVRVHLPMDADGRKRGFGFVTMASAETAKTRPRRAAHGGPARAPPRRQPRPPQGRAACAAGGGGGGGGFGGAASPSASSFGGGGGRRRGPTHRSASSKSAASAPSRTAAGRPTTRAAKKRRGARRRETGSTYDEDDE